MPNGVCVVSGCNAAMASPAAADTNQDLHTHANDNDKGGMGHSGGEYVGMGYSTMDSKETSPEVIDVVVTTLSGQEVRVRAALEWSIFTLSRTVAQHLGQEERWVKLAMGTQVLNLTQKVNTIAHDSASELHISAVAFDADEAHMQEAKQHCIAQGRHSWFAFADTYEMRNGNYVLPRVGDELRDGDDITMEEFFEEFYEPFQKARGSWDLEAHIRRTDPHSWFFNVVADEEIGCVVTITCRICGSSGFASCDYDGGDASFEFLNKFFRCR